MIFFCLVEHRYERISYFTLICGFRNSKYSVAILYDIKHYSKDNQYPISSFEYFQFIF